MKADWNPNINIIFVMPFLSFIMHCCTNQELMHSTVLFSHVNHSNTLQADIKAAPGDKSVSRLNAKIAIGNEVDGARAKVRHMVGPCEKLPKE